MLAKLDENYFALSDEFIRWRLLTWQRKIEGVSRLSSALFNFWWSKANWKLLRLVFNFRITRQFDASQHTAKGLHGLFKCFNKIFSLSMTSFLNTYFFSRLPAPVSRNPLAKGLLSIFSCVICEEIWISYRFQPTARFNSLFHFDMQSQQWTRSLWTRTSERLNTAIWGYRWFELNGIAVDICALSSVSSVEGNWNH